MLQRVLMCRLARSHRRTQPNQSPVHGCGWTACCGRAVRTALVPSVLSRGVILAQFLSAQQLTLQVWVPWQAM